MTETRQFGPYSLVKKIASGGMAEIYLAQTQGIEGFQKHLVLKMIHPKWSQDQSFVSMLVEEAKLAVHLNHANIAQIFDLGQQDGQYYIAMEYVDGKDLFQLLVRTSELDSYLPFDVAAHITEQVASALHYAHDRRDPQGRNLQLIHRDVSPQNLIVSVHGEVKLIDFGIAKATMRPGHTQVGIIKGKFYYMSPEQAWGRPLDRRTDIFSLGICLHEMLTGQMLYADDDQMRLLEKVRAADVPRPSDLRPGVPPELDTICMRALARDADKRFQTGFDFQRALAEYLHRHAAGFTSQRVARMMYDLFPDAYKRATSPEQPMSSSDFSKVRPPESVIFDISKVAASTKGSPPPAGSPAQTVSLKGLPSVPVRSRREPTRPVPAVPESSGDGALFGDGLPQSYDPVQASHPPPPLSSEAPVGDMPQDSTKIVDWNAFRERHPQRTPDPTSPPPGLHRAPSAPTAAADERTMMFTPGDVNQALAKPGVGGSDSGLRRKSATNPSVAEPFERTTMFTPPGPGEANPAERTTMFEPGKAILQGAPSPSGDTAAKNGTGPGEAMPHERTMMFDPAAAGFLDKKPEADEDDPPTTPFTPLPEIVADLQKGRSRDSSAGRAAKPEPKRASQDDLAARVAAAKAKKAGQAKSGGSSQDDLAAKVKAAKAKKAAGGGGDMAARVAAAKAQKAAAAAGKDDGADSGGSDDSLSAQKKAAREKAKRRAGDVGAPKRAAAKGNARSNVRIAGQTKVFGVIDAASGTGRFLKRALPVLLVLFAFSVIIVCAGGYWVFQQVKPQEGPQYGTLIINSNPSGAKVFIDGTSLDAKTPYVLANAEVNRGYDVRLELDNFQPWLQREVKISEAKEAVDINAQLARVEGTLDILTNVEATVSFGGEEKCLKQKRCQITPVTWLPGGFVEVVVEAEGYRTEELVLQWPKDDERGFGPTFQHEVTMQPK